MKNPYKHTISVSEIVHFASVSYARSHKKIVSGQEKKTQKKIIILHHSLLIAVATTMATSDFGLLFGAAKGFGSLTEVAKSRKKNNKRKKTPKTVVLGTFFFFSPQRGGLLFFLFLCHLMVNPIAANRGQWQQVAKPCVFIEKD